MVPLEYSIKSHFCETHLTLPTLERPGKYLRGNSVQSGLNETQSIKRATGQRVDCTQLLQSHKKSIWEPKVQVTLEAERPRGLGITFHSLKSWFMLDSFLLEHEQKISFRGINISPFLIQSICGLPIIPN